MSFSQTWDTGFKSLLIFLGVVFLWLGLVEPLFASRMVSEVVMSLTAVLLAAAFFVYARRRFVAERRRADAEIQALFADDDA